VAASFGPTPASGVSFLGLTADPRRDVSPFASPSGLPGRLMVPSSSSPGAVNGKKIKLKKKHAHIKFRLFFKFKLHERLHGTVVAYLL
jgi:hypothetical protein